MTNKAFLFWAPGSHPTSVDSGTSWHPYNRKKVPLQLPPFTDSFISKSKSELTNS